MTRHLVLGRATAILGLVSLWGWAPNSLAEIIELTSDFQCSAGTAAHGISVSDVTGNNGGATDCFGAYAGNDRGPNTTLRFDGMDYEFVSKVEMNDGGSMGGFEGQNIGWNVSGEKSGSWAFNQSTIDLIGDFILVIKAANDPGWAAFAFWGAPANTSYEGDFSVAWNKGLSHMTLYAKEAASVPEPATLMLLGTGIALLGAGARKRRAVQQR